MTLYNEYPRQESSSDISSATGEFYCFRMQYLSIGAVIPLDEQSQRQPDEQDMFQNDLDEQPHGWGWQRGRGAEWQDNKVHDNENAKSIQERANDGVAAYESNPLGALDKNTGNYKGKEEVKEHPEQGGGGAACEGGFTQCTAGYILI